MFEVISENLKQAKKIVFVTGAGISQESGIPTFRGKDGHWRKHDSRRRHDGVRKRRVLFHLR